VGFWLLLGTPDLPSGEGGVLCGGGLLVEKMNSVDHLFFFFKIRIVGRFFLTVNSGYFFFRSKRI
jgi:hypothetical protein